MSVKKIEPFDDFNIRWRGYGKTSKEKFVNYGITIIGKPEFKEKQIEEIL